MLKSLITASLFISSIGLAATFKPPLVADEVIVEFKSTKWELTESFVGLELQIVYNGTHSSDEALHQEFIKVLREKDESTQGINLVYKEEQKVLFSLDSATSFENAWLGFSRCLSGFSDSLGDDKGHFFVFLFQSEDDERSVFQDKLKDYVTNSNCYQNGEPLPESHTIHDISYMYVERRFKGLPDDVVTRNLKKAYDEPYSVFAENMQENVRNKTLAKTTEFLDSLKERSLPYNSNLRALLSHVQKQEKVNATQLFYHSLVGLTSVEDIKSGFQALKESKAPSSTFKTAMSALEQLNSFCSEEFYYSPDGRLCAEKLTNNKPLFLTIKRKNVGDFQLLMLLEND